MVRIKCVLIFCVLVLLSGNLLAAPTFQAYSPSGEAGSFSGDEDTWFVHESTFDLTVVGAYQAFGSNGQKETASLTNVTLVLSVLQGEQGTVSITSYDGETVTLLTQAAAVNGTGYSNPAVDADLNILTDNDDPAVSLDGYSEKDFLPDGQFNNHSPFQKNASDFLVFGLEDFGNGELVHDYNADGGTTLLTGNYGEEKEYSVTLTGFTRVHIDVYGYESYVDGNSEMQAAWMVNPASHDVTVVPVPGAAALGSMGIVMVGWLRRRRTI